MKSSADRADGAENELPAFPMFLGGRGGLPWGEGHVLWSQVSQGPGGRWPKQMRDCGRGGRDEMGKHHFC